MEKWCISWPIKWTICDVVRSWSPIGKKPTWFWLGFGQYAGTSSLSTLWKLLAIVNYGTRDMEVNPTAGVTSLCQRNLLWIIGQAFLKNSPLWPSWLLLLEVTKENMLSFSSFLAGAHNCRAMPSSKIGPTRKISWYTWWSPHLLRLHIIEKSRQEKRK